MKQSRPRRISLWLAVRIPEPLLANPERIVVNVAAVLIGAGALVPPEASAPAVWPDWVRYEWSGAMIIAGLAALHGAWTGLYRTERLGACLYAICALQYAFQVIQVFHWAGFFTFVIFSLLAFAKIVRLIRSVASETAARDRIDP